MNPQEVRQMVTEHTLSLPYEILTRGGKTYAVADHANAWIPPAYPNTLIVAVPGRGIATIRLETIDSITSRT